MDMRLSQEWIDKLVRLPESGMGYQAVRVHLKNGDVIEHACVFNAELLRLPVRAPGFSGSDIKDIEVEPPLPALLP